MCVQVHAHVYVGVYFHLRRAVSMDGCRVTRGVHVLFYVCDRTPAAFFLQVQPLFGLAYCLRVPWSRFPNCLYPSHKNKSRVRASVCVTSNLLLRFCRRDHWAWMTRSRSPWTSLSVHKS